MFTTSSGKQRTDGSECGEADQGRLDGCALARPSGPLGLMSP